MSAATSVHRGGIPDATFADIEEQRQELSRPGITPCNAKATASVVSDVLLPHEPQLVQRGHRQRGRRQVHLLRRR